MKKIILIILVIVMTGCKTQKSNCDAYGKVNTKKTPINTSR
jgi:hypothetical protein